MSSEQRETYQLATPMAWLAPAKVLPQGERASSVPGKDVKTWALAPRFLQGTWQKKAIVFTFLATVGNRGKRRFWECLGRGRTGTQPRNLQLFWDPGHNGCHQQIINAPVYSGTCKDGQQSVWTYHPSPSLPWEKGAVIHIQPSQTAKADTAVMLTENTALPKTFHPSDELAPQ